MDATFHDETWSLFYGVLIEHELTVGTTPWAGDYPASRPLQGSTNTDKHARLEWASNPQLHCLRDEQQLMH